MTENKELKLLHLGWEEIQSLAEVVSEQIGESEFRPGIIVAVSRGGFAPARILSDQLMVQRLTCVQIEYYTGVNQTKLTPRLVFPLNADVSDSRVLIVDDVSDTGTSIKMAMDHVSERGVLDIRSATLHVKPWTTFRPDYFAAEVDTWIVYPWERYEMIKAMAERMKAEDLTPKEVLRRLVDIGFNQKRVRRIFEEDYKT